MIIMICIRSELLLLDQMLTQRDARSDGQYCSLVNKDSSPELLHQPLAQLGLLPRGTAEERLLEQTGGLIPQQLGGGLPEVVEVVLGVVSPLALVVWVGEGEGVVGPPAVRLGLAEDYVRTDVLRVELLGLQVWTSI